VLHRRVDGASLGEDGIKGVITIGQPLKCTRNILMNNFFKTTYTCFLASSVLAALFILLNKGRGATDLKAFLLWAFAFGVAVGFVKECVWERLLHLPLPLRYSVSIASGVLFGMAWTYILNAYYGVWIGSFSFPILPCLIAGGVVSMIRDISPHNTFWRFPLLELFIIAVLSLGVLALWKPLSIRMTGDQQLEVLSFKLRQGPQSLTLQDNDRDHLRDDLGLLKHVGISGDLTFSSSSGPVGNGKPARAVIIMYHQLNEPVELPQPDGTVIIYVQSEGGWNRYPADAPVLNRSIKLWADPIDPGRLTRYSIERGDGSRQGGTLFAW
jgi:hypothetical protein